MNIQISGLPDNQKIKSINFNIEFDSSDATCSMDFVSVNNGVETKPIVQTGSTEPTKSLKLDSISSMDEKSEIIKPDDIDISNRVAKIDPNMLEETF